MGCKKAAPYNCDHIGLNSVYDPFELDRKPLVLSGLLRGTARTHSAETGSPFKFSHSSTGFPILNLLGQ
jgi:hypothetical protein